MRSVFVLSLLVVAALAAPSHKAKKPFGDIDWTYWSLDEIYEYMESLATDFPEITVLEHMGTSEGGVQIRGLRVASAEHLARETLPVVFVTAGVSARDWVSTMAAVNLIHELVEYYEEYQNIVDNVEWFIIPVANVDGYEFSRTAGNRAWIKNRSVQPDTECIGVNIERNFVFNWGLDLASSSDPCSDNFRGPEGDSEEETKTIQFANDIFRRVSRGYITIRAGSAETNSMITYPFSSNNELFQSNFQDQMGVANVMTDAIWRGTGGRFRSTSEANAAGFISGTSGDYASGVDQIPFVYTIYAPLGGPNGWDTPEPELNSAVDQIFAGIAAFAEYVTGLPLPDPIQ